MIYDCPFCHHQDATLHKRNERLNNGGSRDVYLCNECRILYPRPRSDLESMNLFFKQQGRKQEYQELADPTTSFGQRKCLMRLLHSLKNLLIEDKADYLYPIKKMIKGGGDALDIGTYTGRMCFILEEFGYKAYGLEPQDKAVKFGRDKGLKIYKGSFPDKMPGELMQMKFKLICFTEVMCNFGDLKKSFELAREMLLSDGYLYIKIHQGKSEFYRNNSLFSRYGDFIQNMPTLDALCYYIEKSGFELCHLSGMSMNIVFFQKLLNQKLLNSYALLFDQLLQKISDLFFLSIRKADRLVLLAKKSSEVV